MTVELSSDQACALECLLNWVRKPYSLMTFGGYAGSGKTTLISELAREIGGDKKIAFCAPTGRAASVLRKKLLALGVDLERHSCSTIHSLVALPIEDEETGEITGWRDRDSIGDFDLLIVDEASMVGLELFRMLEQYHIPILAVGDHAQLPPIMSLLNLMSDPKVKLEKVHRQAEDNPIIRLASKIRNGSSVNHWDEDEDGERIRIIPRIEWKSELSRLYNKNDPSFYYEGWPEFALLDRVVLCQTNTTRNRFNQATRKIQRRSKEPEVGDLVVCLKNIKYAGVYNGFRGVLTHKTELDEHLFSGGVSFPSENQAFYNRFCRHQFGRDKTISSYADLLEYGLDVKSWQGVGHLFDYAYVMTVHKAQGSEWPLVVLCKESRSFGMSQDNYRRWLYTAITRASDRLVVLV